jgi:exo-beta-1,3-glucanase (GH17 family)
MSTRSRRHQVRLAAMIVLLVAAALVAAASSLLAGRPVAVAEAPDERIDCVSYAPFHRSGETPFDPLARVTRERIEADLAALSRRTNCVRTYSVDQGLSVVPEVAAGLGMEVLLGAWLSRDRVANTAELDRAIALAQAHPDVVRGLIVGNEVLLRRELPADELEAALRQARASAGVPVTYADVWEFWLRHPELLDAVDFVTIHILPYWEDEPVGIDRAVTHVREIYRHAQRALDLEGESAKALLIGETGWPSAGRARREAQPGRIEQARFVREFVAMAQAENIPYNLIEAFDQPWKRQLEGAMGGQWGIFDSAGAPKFPWRGPVASEPGWQRGLWSAGLSALCFALAGVLANRFRPPDMRLAATRSSTLPVLAQALAGFAVGAVLFAQWRYMQTWNRWTIEWAATLPFFIATAPLAWLGLKEAVEALTGASGDTGAAHRPVAVGHSGDWARGPTLLGSLRAMFLFGAAVNLVLLVFDARYRGFPTAFFLVPAAVEALRLLARKRLAVSAETRLLALVVAVAAVCVLLLEGLENREALLYCTLMLAYAIARIDDDFFRTRTRPPSRAPIADGS